MSLRILEHGFLFEQHSVKTQNISSSYDWEKCALKDLIPSFFSLNVEIILVFQVNWDNFVAESRWIPLRLFYLRLKLKKQNLIVMCHHWQGVSRAVFRLWHLSRTGAVALTWGILASPWASGWRERRTASTKFCERRGFLLLLHSRWFAIV